MFDQNVRSQVFVLLSALWRLLKSKRHQQLAALVVLMLVGALAEVFTLGAVMPFLNALFLGDQGAQTSAQEIEVFWRFGMEMYSIKLLTLVFVLAISLSACLRLALSWMTARLAVSIGSDISFLIYGNTLYQPYLSQVSSKSSELIAGISRKIDAVIYRVLIPSLTFLTNLLLLTAIGVTLIIISPVIAGLVLGVFGLLYVLVSFFIRGRLSQNSKTIANSSSALVKIIQEGRSGVKDIILNNTQNFFLGKFRKIDFAMRRAQGDNQFLGESPRPIFEGFGIIFMAILAYRVGSSGANPASFLSILGVVVLGAARALPLLQRVFWSWSAIMGEMQNLQDVLKLAKTSSQDSRDKITKSQMQFRHRILLTDIYFRYPDKSRYIFEKLNLEILKGSFVGLRGATGKGKSTLMDLLLGLFEPERGGIIVDGTRLTKHNIQEWRNIIAHVPQEVFICDGTIADNITFASRREVVDNDDLNLAVDVACLTDFVQTLDSGLETQVGENGVSLSGGQRQRIGIARAIYSRANILLLDEATSALDRGTERRVLNAIKQFSPGLTVVMISHNLTSDEYCDVVLDLGGI